MKCDYGGYCISKGRRASASARNLGKVDKVFSRLLLRVFIALSWVYAPVWNNWFSGLQVVQYKLWHHSVAKYVMLNRSQPIREKPNCQVQPLTLKARSSQGHYKSSPGHPLHFSKWKGRVQFSHIPKKHYFSAYSVYFENWHAEIHTLEHILRQFSSNFRPWGP